MTYAEQYMNRLLDLDDLIGQRFERRLRQLVEQTLQEQTAPADTGAGAGQDETQSNHHMKKVLIMFALLTIATTNALADNGDIFTAPATLIKDGVTTQIDMKFEVIDEDAKECEVRGRFIDYSNYDRAVPLTTEGEIFVPATANEYTVVGVQNFAFYQCDKLTGFTFAEGIRYIDGVPCYQSGATYCVIPSTVERMDHPFFRCKNLVSVTINREYPPDVDHIGFEDIDENARLYVPNAYYYDDLPWTDWFKSKNIISTDTHLYIAGIRLESLDGEGTDKLLEEMAENDYGLMEDYLEGIPEIRYDGATNTLTLKDIRMTVPDDAPAIINGALGRRGAGIPDLKVNIEGNCEFRCKDTYAVMENDGGITFTGNGKLTLTSQLYGMRVNTVVAIDGPDVSVQATEESIFADNSDYNAKVAVLSGRLSLYGRALIQDWELGPDMEIQEPWGATYGYDANEDRMGIIDSYGYLIGDLWIVIGKKPGPIMPVSIAFDTIREETDWDALNQKMADIYGMTGTFSFDKDSKTLTLDNVNVTVDFESGGFVELYDAIDFPDFKDITVCVKGDNRIENTGSGYCIYLGSNNFRLTGDGTLTLKNSMEYPADNFMGNAVYMMGGEDEDANPWTLTIDGPTVVMDADNSLALYDEGDLAVMSGELRARGLLGPLFVWGDITIGEGMGITTPEDAYFDTDEGMMMQGGEYMKGGEWLVIGKATPTAISAVNTVSDGDSAVYDLQGRRVGGQGTAAQGQLPKGIYISKGRKVVF